MIKRVFVPDRAPEQTGGALQKRIRQGLPEILLKLAAVKGYNSSNNIRGPGGFIPDTDVGALALYACSPEKYIKGKKEFAWLLSHAGVESNVIANETIQRRMLDTRSDSRSPSPPPPPTPTQSDVNALPPPPPLHQAPSTSTPAPTPDPLPPPPPLRYLGRPTPRRIVSRQREPEPHEIPLPEPVRNVPTKRGAPDASDDLEKRFAADGYSAYRDEDAFE